MQQTTHTTQVFTPFGNGYVPEQRGDDTPSNLEPSAVVGSLTVSLLEQALKALRGAVGGRRS
jgi:hypothetical protein